MGAHSLTRCLARRLPVAGLALTVVARAGREALIDFECSRGDRAQNWAVCSNLTDAWSARADAPSELRRGAAPW